MRELLNAIALAIVAAVLGLVLFAIYAATAVVYGAPLVFILWLTGAI